MDRMSVLRAARALAVLLGVVTFAACESSTAVAISADVATSLSITAPPAGSAGQLVLEVGDTVTVTALATNALGLPVTTGPVTWSSSDTDVVEIDATGLVSATGVGSAEIRAVSGGAVSSLPTIVGDSATF